MQSPVLNDTSVCIVSEVSLLNRRLMYVVVIAFVPVVTSVSMEFSDVYFMFRVDLFPPFMNALM